MAIYSKLQYKNQMEMSMRILRIETWARTLKQLENDWSAG